MYTPAAIQKILVDFSVCVDDQSAWAIISSPLDNDETIKAVRAAITKAGG